MFMEAWKDPYSHNKLQIIVTIFVRCVGDVLHN